MATGIILELLDAHRIIDVTALLELSWYWCLLYNAQ